jgi:hypothetical protein
LVVLSWRFQLERAEESVHEEKEALRRTQRATQLQLQVGSSLFHPRPGLFKSLHPGKDFFRIPYTYF